jgi:copper transport protein
LRWPRLLAAGRLLRRRGARAAFLALLAGAGVLALGLPASAHAVLDSATPADGGSVHEAPEVVSLTFTEEPEPNLMEVQVLDAGGDVVSTGPASVVAGKPDTLEVPLGDVGEGVYTVTWRVVSRVDGHTTAGAFAFGVGVEPGEAAVRASVRGHESPPPSPWEIAGRWLLFVGAGLLVGVAWTASLAFQEPPRGVRGLAAGAWGASMVGVVSLGIGQAVATGAGLGAFLGSSVGRAVVLRAVAVAMAGGALVATRRWVRTGLVVAGLAGAVALLVHVATGHANARSDLRGGMVAAQWVHVMAGGVWLGGLAAVLVGVRGEPSDRKSRAVRRFSTVAGVALFVVLGTGVVRSIKEVPSWDALFSSLYGRLVLVKAGLLVALGGLGAVNRYRNVRRAGRSLTGLRRVSRAELALAASVLAAAAVMASVPPPEAHPALAAEHAGIEATGTDFARTVRVRLRVTPGGAGRNAFEVRATNPRTGQPIGADRVELGFTFLGPGDVGASVLELRPAGPGTYRAEGANLSLAGPWEVDVVVQRPTDSVEIGLRVGTLCRAHPTGTDPTLWTADTSAGTVQGYLDPAVPGSSEVHATFFDQAGRELPATNPEIVATGPGGEGSILDPRRLGPGHFVASVDLEAGRWRFDFSATADDGALLSGCFEETI